MINRGAIQGRFDDVHEMLENDSLEKDGYDKEQLKHLSKLLDEIQHII